MISRHDLEKLIYALTFSRHIYCSGLFTGLLKPVTGMLQVFRFIFCLFVLFFSKRDMRESNIVVTIILLIMLIILQTNNNTYYNCISSSSRRSNICYNTYVSVVSFHFRVLSRK